MPTSRRRPTVEVLLEFHSDPSLPLFLDHARSTRGTLQVTACSTGTADRFMKTLQHLAWALWGQRRCPAKEALWGPKFPQPVALSRPSYLWSPGALARFKRVCPGRFSPSQGPFPPSTKSPRLPLHTLPWPASSLPLSKYLPREQVAPLRRSPPRSGKNFWLLGGLCQLQALLAVFWLWS